MCYLKRDKKTLTRSKHHPMSVEVSSPEEGSLVSDLRGRVLYHQEGSQERHEGAEDSLHSNLRSPGEAGAGPEMLKWS